MTQSLCLAPVSLGSLELLNKLILPAMTMGFCDTTGRITQRFCDFYLNRAKGGPGLMVLEGAAVHPDGQMFARQFNLMDDSNVTGLAKLVDALHERDVKVAVQLSHAGRLGRPNRTGCPAWGPCRGRIDGAPVMAATPELLERVTADFAAAARRAAAAGVDAIELNAGQGLLLQQFHSRATNHRHDAYGGSLAGRARLTREIMQALRQILGPAFPLILQLGVSEAVPDGLSLAESCLLAPLLADEADAVHVTAGHPQTPHWLAPSWSAPEAETAMQAEAIKSTLALPVIAGGRISSLAMADQLLKQGQADCIAIGRPLLADSLMVRKTASGFAHRIRPCVLCDACIELLTTGQQVTCSVNPFVGREGDEHEFYPSGRPLHVLVAGGGPSGMAAAVTLRHKGHRVTLLEKTAQLGGHLRGEARGVVGRPLEDYVAFLTCRATEMGIDVQFRQEADETAADRLRPHVIVSAVGALPLLPDIPGLDTTPFLLAESMLREGVIPPEGKAVVLGGGVEGCQTAQWLARQGREVTLIYEGSLLAHDATRRTRVQLTEHLQRLGVVCLHETRVVQLSPERLLLCSHGQTRPWRDYGTLVLALGYCANPTLRRRLVSRGFSVIESGDCVAPGTLGTAIAQGVNVGLML